MVLKERKLPLKPSSSYLLYIAILSMSKGFYFYFISYPQLSTNIISSNKQLHHRTKRQNIIDKTNKTIVKQNFHKHIKNPKNKIYRIFIELLELKKFYWNPKCIKCPDNNFPTFAFWNDHSFIISSISCWISSNLRCIMWYCLYPSLNEKIRLTQKIIILLFPANCSSIKSQHKSIIINGILNLRQME